MDESRKPNETKVSFPSGFGSRILELLSGVEHLELEHVEIEIGDMELFIPLGAVHCPPAAIPSEKPAPVSLIPETFLPPVFSYPGKIRQVTLGARANDGGSRGSTVTIGGSSAPAFSSPDHFPPYPPVIAMDVFDMSVPLPRALKSAVAEVMHDPAEWARMNVEEFGAQAITIHLMSTDPLIADRAPREAAMTVEDVLQAVDVPLIIGGCGHPTKDAKVFAEIAEMASGERLLLNSVTLEMAEAHTLEDVAIAAQKNGHLVLAFSGLDLNSAKELNRRLYEYLPPESIVMDLTTVALGYGLEYSFTIHERARLAALTGDTELAHPTISASTNAWAAREAWLAMDPVYGPREIRGPLWETLNALILLLAGVDLFMMMHPAAVRTMRAVSEKLSQPGIAGTGTTCDWVQTRW
jgi:acetyl-CoA decarbonylase/synthase complex subunit delta